MCNGGPICLFWWLTWDNAECYREVNFLSFSWSAFLFSFFSFKKKLGSVSKPIVDCMMYKMLSKYLFTTPAIVISVTLFYFILFLFFYREIISLQLLKGTFMRMYFLCYSIKSCIKALGCTSQYIHRTFCFWFLWPSFCVLYCFSCIASLSVLYILSYKFFSYLMLFEIIKQIICLAREGEWSKDCERCQVNKCRQNFRE